MKIMALKKYGQVLTGREFAFNVYKELANKINYPVVFDFDDINSMGSSFADEFILPIARKQDNKIYVKNVNQVVQFCLNDLVDEENVEIINVS